MQSLIDHARTCAAMHVADPRHTDTFRAFAVTVVPPCPADDRPQRERMEARTLTAHRCYHEVHTGAVSAYPSEPHGVAYDAKTSASWSGPAGRHLVGQL